MDADRLKKAMHVLSAFNPKDGAARTLEHALWELYGGQYVKSDTTGDWYKCGPDNLWRKVEPSGPKGASKIVEELNSHELYMAVLDCLQESLADVPDDDDLDQVGVYENKYNM